MGASGIKTYTLKMPARGAIRYFDTETDGPPIVLANGLGAPFDAWRHQVNFLKTQYRVLSWDYRGIFDPPQEDANDANRNGAARNHLGPEANTSNGSPPNGETRQGRSKANPAINVPEHARDLLALLDATGVKQAACVGWSMGAQVLLDLYSQAPERISHLVFLSGTFGRPFDDVAVPGAATLLPWMLHRGRPLRPLLERLVRRAVRWPETPFWLKRTRLLSKTVDEAFFREVAAAFSEMNFEGYLDTLALLGSHDVRHLIPNVAVPTLLITGARDPLTPPRIAESLVTELPRGELTVIPDGSHYAPIEFPELINLRIEKFLLEQGYAPKIADDAAVDASYA
jgi:pimeloyl-ACP methyl ester carboxylesterase